MKKLLFILLLLAFAVWLGWQMQQDSGYVLISYGHWSIECSLWTALILLLLLFIGFYWSFRLIAHASTLTMHWARWRKRYRQRQSLRSTQIAVCELIEGKNQHAEQHFKKWIADSQMPLLNYFGAALAAQQQDASDRREQYLRQAAAVPGAEITVGFMQARLQIQAQQWSAAQQTLDSLKHLTSKNHPQIISLEQQILQKSE